MYNRTVLIIETTEYAQKKLQTIGYNGVTHRQNDRLLDFVIYNIDVLNGSQRNKISIIPILFYFLVYYTERF